MTDFRRVLEALANHDVAHIVVGGAAIGLHGSSYRTQDIAIVYEHDRDNVAKLVAALKPFKPRLRVAGEPEGVPFVFDVQTVLNGGSFTMTTAIGDIDILSTIAGIGDYAEAMKYADWIPAISQDRPTPVLSLDGLIIAKRAANRPKDLLVLPELEAMRELRALEDT